MPTKPGTNQISQRIVHRVRHLRQKRAMTTRALAKAMDDLGFPITEMQIRGRESRLGTRTVTADDLVGFSMVLGVPVADLLAEHHCGTCDDLPLAGFTCNACGNVGAVLP